jgi:hypothetical protein
VNGGHLVFEARSSPLFIFRALVGFLHDIAPSAQRFVDAKGHASSADEKLSIKKTPVGEMPPDEMVADR